MDKQALPFSTLDEYIALQTPAIRPLLAAMRQAIREAAPEATERIRYGIPTYYLHENLVHFAAFQRHIGFYPGPEGIERYRNRFEAEGLKCSKGAVQFPLDRPLPLGLVREIAAFRTSEAKRAHEGKRAAKRAR